MCEFLYVSKTTNSKKYETVNQGRCWKNYMVTSFRSNSFDSA